MLQLQSALLVIERPPVDAVSSGAIAPHDVTSLADEALHNAVEFGALQAHSMFRGKLHSA